MIFILKYYYDLSSEFIMKLLYYNDLLKSINKLNIIDKNIDDIIHEYLIGDYKILKINNYEYPIIKNYFNSEFLNNIFKNNNKIIKIEINDCILSKNICNYIITFLLFYKEPLILHINYTDNNINYIKYKINYIDNFINNMTLYDFHIFVRILNILKRYDFNILYSYILENSINLSNDTLIKDIKITDVAQILNISEISN